MKKEDVFRSCTFAAAAGIVRRVGGGGDAGDDTLSLTQVGGEVREKFVPR